MFGLFKRKDKKQQMYTENSFEAAIESTSDSKNFNSNPKESITCDENGISNKELFEALRKELGVRSKEIPLKKTIELTDLSLSNINQGIDFSFLKYFPKVQHLYIDNVKINSFIGAEKSDSLKEVNLYDLETINDIDFSPLFNLERDFEIDFESIKYVDLDKISGMKNLTCLCIDTCEDVTNLDSITKHKNLQYLFLDNLNIDSIKFVVDLCNLYELSIDNTITNDLDKITENKNIKSIMLWGKNYTNIDWIKNMDSLEEIGLEGTNITDLTPLLTCKNIKRVDIRNSIVTDLETIALIPKLQNLVLWDNNISDLSPLKDCTQLKEIFLHKNPIKIGKIKRSMPNLAKIIRTL